MRWLAWFPWGWRRFAGLDIGQRGERAAAAYLQGLGYRIVERGKRLPGGELDLIALDGNTVVFVEVKSRQAPLLGPPEEAVTPEKQRRLTRLALRYLKRHGLLERRARFDVVAVVWPPEANRPTIKHIPNAFPPLGQDSFFS